jgi:glutamate racemase
MISLDGLAALTLVAAGSVLAVIGVFDSGLGGLGVVRQIRDLLPDHDILYVADRARAPYGRRPLEQVRTFSEEITAHLIAEGAELVVVACNSASAVALSHLRRLHPHLPFVGMEPALKPAVAVTRTGIIAVLATAATFQGELFESLIDRFGDGVTIIRQVCDGWVELVEQGVVEGPVVEAAVAEYLAPVLAAGADTVVLGCTHYPFLAPEIGRLAGPAVSIIDPAPAVARQMVRLAPGAGRGRLSIEVTGPSSGVSRLVHQLTGLDTSVRTVTLARHE